MNNGKYAIGGLVSKPIWGNSKNNIEFEFTKEIIKNTNEEQKIKEIEMKNYICINGKKIELTEEQIAQIEKSVKVSQRKLANIPVGGTFKIGEYEFIVLEHAKETTAVILKGLLKDEENFGNNNNYNASNVDNICRSFGDKIEKIIGKENLIEHTVDLTADDGLKCYGKAKRFMSLLTADLYRRYVEILDKYKIGKWWWLSTPHSTPKHDNANWVKCVSPHGLVSSYCCGGNIGVRPFCILNSNIFVS